MEAIASNGVWGNLIIAGVLFVFACVLLGGALKGHEANEPQWGDDEAVLGGGAR
jgi:hypothetical protein